MIREIYIYDIYDSMRATDGERRFTAWLSVNDPQDQENIMCVRKKMERQGIIHFSRFFEDVITDDKLSPQLADVQAIVDFWKKLKEDPKEHIVGVNCAAGISRSTATAMIGWMMQGFQPEFALQKVVAVRKCAFPNRKILRLFKDISGVCSEQALEDQFSAKKGILLY